MKYLTNNMPAPTQYRKTLKCIEIAYKLKERMNLQR